MNFANVSYIIIKSVIVRVQRKNVVIFSLFSAMM